MFIISLRSLVSSTLCMPYLLVSVVCRPTRMLAALVPLPSYRQQQGYQKLLVLSSVHIMYFVYQNGRW